MRHSETVLLPTSIIGVFLVGCVFAFGCEGLTYDLEDVRYNDAQHQPNDDEFDAGDNGDADDPNANERDTSDADTADADANDQNMNDDCPDGEIEYSGAGDDEENGTCRAQCSGRNDDCSTNEYCCMECLDEAQTGVCMPEQCDRHGDCPHWHDECQEFDMVQITACQEDDCGDDNGRMFRDRCRERCLGDLDCDSDQDCCEDCTYDPRGVCLPEQCDTDHDCPWGQYCDGDECEKY